MYPQSVFVVVRVRHGSCYPRRRRVVVFSVVPEVTVEVSDRCLLADLRVLKMHDFDVIFRMDWLS